jgi:O-phosphoseryl-tRNA(Cys) synthetase
MQNILEKFGVKKYFFWSEENFHHYYTPETESYIKKHFDLLLINDKMGIDYLKCAHPSLEGHKKISEILYEYFFNKNT